MATTILRPPELATTCSACHNPRLASRPEEPIKARFALTLMIQVQEYLDVVGELIAARKAQGAPAEALLEQARQALQRAKYEWHVFVVDRVELSCKKLWSKRGQPSPRHAHSMERNSVVLPLIALGIAGMMGLLLFVDFSRQWAAEQARRAAIRPATLDGQIGSGNMLLGISTQRQGSSCTGLSSAKRFLWPCAVLGTAGWPWGWGEPDQVQMMKDADFVIAYVDQTGLHLEDSFGVDFVAHAPDTELGGRDDILEKAGSEQEGSTVVEFRRRLDTETLMIEPSIPAL
jgi:hypothetical protein